MNISIQLGLLLCLTLPPALLCLAHADDLGRLFTTPAERARIDNQHSDVPSQEAMTIGNSGERIVVNGTLRGSDGKHLVWLNGSQVQADQASDVSLLRDGRVKLNWRDGAKILKPGQGFDTSSGEIFDYRAAEPVATPIPAVAVDTKPDTRPDAASSSSIPKAASEEQATAAATPTTNVGAKAKQ